MAHPRKRPAPATPPASSSVPERPVANDPDPASAAAEDRERTSDLLVQLTAAYLRDRIDWEDPAMAPFVDWLAAEARAAMSPAERAALAREADAFAARLRREIGERDGSKPTD